MKWYKLSTETGVGIWALHSVTGYFHLTGMDDYMALEIQWQLCEVVVALLALSIPLKMSIDMIIDYFRVSCLACCLYRVASNDDPSPHFSTLKRG